MIEGQEQKGQCACSTLSEGVDAWEDWILQGHGGRGQEFGFYSTCDGSRWKALSRVVV